MKMACEKTTVSVVDAYIEYLRNAFVILEERYIRTCIIHARANTHIFV